MSSKVITFGKYSGETALNVAIVDPSYASWAAQNLKSADWRKAFADALLSAKSATVEEIAAAHESPDSIHYNNVVEQVKADKAKEDRQRKEIDDCIAKWAAQMNVAIEKVAPAIKSYADRNIDPAMLDGKKFSSPAKYEAFKSCLVEVIAIQNRHYLEM
jgi:hypothetical protein